MYRLWCVFSGFEMDAENQSASHIRAWHPLEYAHVFLWLIKDLCWAQGWKTAGSLMVLPAVLVSLAITWFQRSNRFTLLHNLAISLWISSNSIWMLAEFYQAESYLKPISTIGFIMGILLLLSGYIRLFLFRRGKKLR